jgi:hypothetical protein
MGLIRAWCGGLFVCAKDGTNTLKLCFSSVIVTSTGFFGGRNTRVFLPLSSSVEVKRLAGSKTLRQPRCGPSLEGPSAPKRRSIRAHMPREPGFGFRVLSPARWSLRSALVTQIYEQRKRSLCVAFYSG